MTILLQETTAGTQQICHLDRSVPGFPTSQRLATTTHAALREERRRNFINATKLDGKSGGAQWRDLRFSLLSSTHKP
jgi:hypothetical protein